MYILIDVLERDVQILNTYNLDDLSRAQNDLIERCNYYMEDEYLVEGEEYEIDYDHMWAWINSSSGNVDLVIKRI